MGLAGGAQPRNQLQIPLTPNSMSKHSWEGKILPLFFITARYGLVLVPYSPHPNLASLALWKTRLKSVCRTKLIYSMSTHAPPKGSLAVSAVWGLYHMVVVRATKGYGSKRQWDEWTAMPWVDERPIHSLLAIVLACAWDQWPRCHCYHPNWSTEKRLRPILRLWPVAGRNCYTRKKLFTKKVKLPVKQKVSRLFKPKQTSSRLCLLCTVLAFCPRSPDSQGSWLVSSLGLSWEREASNIKGQGSLEGKRIRGTKQISG